MDYSNSLREKYLFEGSPFIIPISDASKMRVAQNVMHNNSWVQDAIVMELLAVEKGNPLTRVDAPERIMQGFLRKNITISPQNYAFVLEGFGLGLVAINIAIKANTIGERETMNYLNTGNPSHTDVRFCKSNLGALKSKFAQDKTCADIFDFIQTNPPSTNEFLRLGIEVGKLYFGIFFAFIVFQMQTALGRERTNQIVCYGSA